jgi:hypothetical protein
MKEDNHMITQTLKGDRENLVHLIERLPDRFILQIKGYIERIREEDDLKAEINALR